MSRTGDRCSPFGVAPSSGRRVTFPIKASDYAANWRNSAGQFPRKAFGSSKPTSGGVRGSTPMFGRFKTNWHLCNGKATFQSQSARRPIDCLKVTGGMGNLSSGMGRKLSINTSSLLAIYPANAMPAQTPLKTSGELRIRLL